jgi:hypothetical protein
MMAWERRKGVGSKQYYLNQRVPEKPYPVKVYYGRHSKANYVAAEVKKRRRKRIKAKAKIEREREEIAEAERLALEVLEWAELLSDIWLLLTGHHQHRSCWRFKRGGVNQG